eukprot:TRINITY_DN18571_c0_g1::TRINITY_DN18571_c0_g1_i1::g.1122::m.1122 TRINITY_DN18571_c0_g1::TRINITY_DN18571_c0_g1_i1::g.1122  ORF type:complete len:219 (+),score=14.07,EphA2_TM/PF14575.1/2.7e+03,EphA2_TM/PF14575.1/2.6e+03,EphA2_TM/PF14575.1/0.49,Holin_LLH/PF09682.5/0.21 TRINITY_DN18571_c0_g1_i1:95-751(+)
MYSLRSCFFILLLLPLLLTTVQAHRKAATATCEDKIKNGLESDVDCGGADCPPCAVNLQCLNATDCVNPLICHESFCSEVQCTDDVRNGEETDVDCGGSSCRPCELHLGCVLDSDCVSTLICSSNNTCRMYLTPEDGEEPEESDSLAYSLIMGAVLIAAVAITFIVIWGLKRNYKKSLDKDETGLDNLKRFFSMVGDGHRPKPKPKPMLQEELLETKK